jgi:hypothetical protein
VNKENQDKLMQVIIEKMITKSFLWLMTFYQNLMEDRVLQSWISLDKDRNIISAVHHFEGFFKGKTDICKTKRVFPGLPVMGHNCTNTCKRSGTLHLVRHSVH